MTRIKIYLIIIGLSLVVILTSIVVVNEKLSKKKKELSKLPGNFLAESAGSQTLPEIVINKEFPNPPEKLAVYKVDNPTINEKTVKAFAEKFEISGPVTFDVFTNTYQVAGKVHVSKTTGDFWITLEDPWNQPPPKSLPDESICREIATSYLKEKGLLPKDAYFWGCGGSSNQNLTPDGLVTEKTVVQVLFRQKISGYKAEGPGSKLSVFIGDKGKVLAVSRIWRQPKFYNKYPLISLEEAIKSLKDGKAVCSDTSDMGKIILENVEIAYYESGWGEKQLYLQPVYKFDGKSLSDNREFHAYLPAVQSAYLEEKTLSKEDWQTSEPNNKKKMKQYTIAGKYFDLKGEAITITTRKQRRAFLFATFLLLSFITIFSTSCQVTPKEENNKEEMTHIPSPSNITLIKEGREFSVNQKSQNFKALSKAFQECLRNPRLKNDAGNTLEHAQYLALIDSVHKKGNGLEVSYKLPVELTYWLDGELQQKKLTKEYCRGQPTFLILLEGPYSGKMIAYEKGNPDPAPLFYYPVRNLEEIKNLFQKILTDET